MLCPNCSSEVPPGPICPRCNAPLATQSSTTPLASNPVFGAPARAADAGPGSVPLTVAQKAWLVVDCLPLCFFVLAFVFSVTVLDDITGAPPPAALPLFLGLVILVTGYQALQRMRDLVSGVALVQEDLLQRLWRPRRGGGHYGTFARLGRLRLTPQAYGRGQPGRRHRVAYSPASKIVWSLEPLD
jgi:hypothetical protein